MTNIIHLEIMQEAINSRMQREYKRGAANIRDNKNQNNKQIMKQEYTSWQTASIP